MPDTVAEKQEAQHRFPCDSCGADLRFDPQAQQLVCDHCGYTEPMGEDVSSPNLEERDFQAALARDPGSVETQDIRLARCENCGAAIEFDDATHATECPFCASPLVIGTGETRQIKPQGLVPFAVTEHDARKAMSDWLGRLWFAPGGLRQYARNGRRMSGIYAPYWTFDADTKSSYTGARGTVYYETRTVRRNGKTETQRVQKVRWRPASGRVARWFDDVLVLASTSLPKRYADGLPPWSLGELTPYTPEYLAGFQAEGYTVELEEGYGQARDHMDAVIRRDIRFDIGGDRQRIHTVNTTVSDVTFKHILLPIWLAAYKYRGKTYRFVVNGQTGKVQGERPWSWIKITLAVIAVAIVAGVIGYMSAQNGGTNGGY